MKQYQNILFVSTGMKDETEALKQALSIARNTQANLKALIIQPQFPPNLEEYGKRQGVLLKEDLLSSIRKIGAEIKFDVDYNAISIETEIDNKPALSIIKRVLKESIDLVIKQAESNESGKGFKAFDMSLLRQCPCPVWLCRPIQRSRQEIKIAVAIESESETAEGRDLSVQLLQAADMLSKDCNQSINVVSCWNYEFEEYLRYNPFTPMPEHEIQDMVLEAETQSKSALNILISNANVISKTNVYHLRGLPEQVIPQYMDDYKIDILVMGTVARSGLAGFFIGNTAENILQKLGCSLVALKPKGFVSPVKAYS